MKIQVGTTWSCIKLSHTMLYQLQGYISKIGKVYSLEYTNIPKVFFTVLTSEKRPRE
jgi:hypothetical protein